MSRAAADDQRTESAECSWVVDRLELMLKIKEKDQKAFLAVDNHRTCIESFFKPGSEDKHLFIYQSHDKKLVLSQEAPEDYKTKVIYFTRLPGKEDDKKGKGSSDPYHGVVYGELPPNALQALHSMTKHVFLPFLKQPQLTKVPQVKQQGLMTDTNSFLANTLVTLGLCEGKTLLPLPSVPLPARIDESHKDKDLLYQLESSIVQWSAQIKLAMRASPEQMLEDAKRTGLHPGPIDEIEFWQKKAENLSNLEAQLHLPSVIKVGLLLKKASSSYWSPFNKLLEQLSDCTREAWDNYRFLSPLRGHFEDVVGGDLQNVSNDGTFRKLFHQIYLVWNNSHHYNTPARLVILIRELSNDVIKLATRFVDPDALFGLDGPEAVTRLSETLSVCGHFKSCYFIYKSKAQKDPGRPWRFQNTALFSRLDAFLERCHDLLDVLETNELFKRLENMRIGGTNGQVFTDQAEAIRNRFLAAYNAFQKPEPPYNILDVDEKRFDADFAKFRAANREMEMEMGSMMVASLEDAGSVYGTFKVVDTFEGFIDRAVIQREWLRKQMGVLQAYHDDLLVVQDLYYKFHEDPSMYPNMPPTASQIVWCKCLLERCKEPEELLRALNRQVWNSELGIETKKFAENLMNILRSYQTSAHNQWAEQVQQNTTEKLKLNLLRRDDDSSNSRFKKVHVNFDPHLIKTLKEVNYLTILQHYGDEGASDHFLIPAQANIMHRERDEYRRLVLQLEYIVNTYNQFMEDMIDEERKLLHTELEAFEQHLAKGMRELTWKSENAIKEFIQVSMEGADDINHVITTLKLNVKTMEDVLEEYIQKDTFLPLTTKDAAKHTMVEAEYAKRSGEWCKQREENLMAKSEFIHRLLGVQAWPEAPAEGEVRKISCLAVLNNLKLKQQLPPLEQDTEQWVKYVTYVNERVTKKICECVTTSLEHLRDQLDQVWLNSNQGLPLLEIKLTLGKKRGMETHLTELRFEPALEARDGASPALDSIIQETISEINRTATWATRLDSSIDTPHYLDDVLSDKKYITLVNEISQLMKTNSVACENFAKAFEVFSDLWAVDINSEFKKFVDKGDLLVPQKTAGDDEGERSDTNVAQRPYFGVPLSEFHQKISYYEDLYAQLQELPESDTRGWVTIDSKPVRNALLSLCQQWRQKYLSYLTEKIVADVRSLNEFIADASAGLEQKVHDDDLESLKGVMKHIRACSKKASEVSCMFSPIEEALAMLKLHVEKGSIKEEMIQEMQDLTKPAPDEWQHVYNKSRTVNEVHAKARSEQQENLETETASQEIQIRSRLENEYRRSKLYHYFKVGDKEFDKERAYEELDYWDQELRNEETRVAILQENRELFGLPPYRFQDLEEARKELLWLKQAWDLISHVQCQFSEWMRTTFKSCDVSSLLDEVQKIKTKQLKSMPSKAKNWPCFLGLEKEVMEMGNSLPLCMELRSPAMRDRHWQELIDLTKCQSGLDPEADDFTLSNLVDLKLHEFANQVSEIVEKATRELGLEKQLSKLNDTWTDNATFQITYEECTRPDYGEVWLLGSTEIILEQLEADNNMLQGMQTNKYVEHFKARVDEWVQQLSTVDICIQKWMEIQRQWDALYPIFILSQDIKEQLPDNAKDFAIADACFRELMRVSQPHRNAVKVCCSEIVREGMGRQEDLLDVLEYMEGILRDCEKAMTDYLESKRKLFPRFYFVSPADLIEILSKGSDPRAVMQHMSKIMDAVDYFQIDGNDNTKSTPGPKDVWRMVSIQGERVRLVEDYSCEGAVEEWMAGCVAIMMKTIKYWIDEANRSYVEKQRIEWIYGGSKADLSSRYCGQAIIVASRIQFTFETQATFAQLEEGTENAMKEFRKLQERQLKELIGEVRGHLDKNDRKMLVHLITIDVHARDVIIQMADEKIDSVDAFQWQSQLRYFWDDRKGSYIQICDAEFLNNYEYIGLCGCLVITKLTDRCYITLSQALRLKKGGAPAGPAGTGKTETTKDLARNLGIACYVFNCSDQMNYITLGQIFKGLAMSGSWGCFDEFNRISIEVLSVVATQVSSILNALKANKKIFNFMTDVGLKILPTVGMWITMNPGYAGRTELPENIKSLFRPCAMCVPDLGNICEIMLAAEGFETANVLAVKFVTLYKLNKELLSPQDHYDWGLRAVKSVLYIAGGLKRADPDLDEGKVLMRALRDTNMAKLSKDDIYVFMGLIKALFPGMEVDKKSNAILKDAVLKASAESGLITSENLFVDKVLQYEELLQVRHSVFVLGPTGCGKTKCWTTLASALGKMPTPDKCQYQVINPKAITSNELYGYVHEVSKEWIDGVLSYYFREFAKSTKKDIQAGKNRTSHWLVLDGIIDAEWIESMNTVMDDNKMLTLTSNERIPLTDWMRMIFEISHLKNASPATVSRAGIIFINESDLGWTPFKDKWIQERANKQDGKNPEADKEVSILDNFFEKYLPSMFEYWKKYLKCIVSVPDLCVVQCICNLLEGLLNKQTMDPKLFTIGEGEEAKIINKSEVLEKYFVFAALWAFGGPLPEFPKNYRAQFSSWFLKEYPAIKIIAETESQKSNLVTAYDKFIDHNQGFEWRLWSDTVKPFTEYEEPSAENPFADITVQTADTVRLTKLMDLFMDNGRPVMFVGTAGTGKSTIIMAKLKSLNPEEKLFRVIAFNSLTNPRDLQANMELSLDKRYGKVYGPPGRKKLVFFLDDLNMPTPDKYGTQEAIALIHFVFDYGFWYDRKKCGQDKTLTDISFLSAMNPKSGTFTVLDRLLRHFGVFACNVPSETDMEAIYGQILTQKFKRWKNNLIRDRCAEVVSATINLHQKICTMFLPNAIKFHYQWNMREMFNIFQGICQFPKALYENVRGEDKGKEGHVTLIRAWIHECARTFRDRLLKDDIPRFDELLMLTARYYFKPEHLPPEFDINQGQETVTESIASLTFMPRLIKVPGAQDEECLYCCQYDTADNGDLQRYLTSALKDYNSNFSPMNLVLFQDAMRHVCRICRITKNPRGNALLVGVGGSGKQSLARLASYINGLVPESILVSGNYGKSEFNKDMQELYKKAGKVNSEDQFCFIITDSQIVDPSQLVYLNDMLNSGNVPDLFPQDDKDALLADNGKELKQYSQATNKPMDYNNKDVVWDWFIQKVRRRLHIVLCFSPGPHFASWCRNFPALVNTTVIDWFHPWPRPALRQVAECSMRERPKGEEPSFQEEMELDTEVVDSIAEYMSFVHASVTQACDDFLAEEKRHCHTTPKSFLELVKSFQKLLRKNRARLNEQRTRLKSGLKKIDEAGRQVADLQKDLAKKQEEVREKALKAAACMQSVSADKAVVEEKKREAEKEEEKTSVIAAEAAALQANANAELAEAIPLVEAAMAALNTIQKEHLTELKGFTKPPDGVDRVTAAVLILLSDPRRIPARNACDWAASKKMMGNLNDFMKRVVEYNLEEIPGACIERIQEYIQDPRFNRKTMETKSAAAAGLCDWVINMNLYYAVHKKVQPLKEKAEQAEQRLNQSKEGLRDARRRVEQLEASFQLCLKKHNDAVEDQQQAEALARKTEEKNHNATRLVHGLHEENLRWKSDVEALGDKMIKLIGDSLLAASFISYIGPFTKNFRERIVEEWMAKLKEDHANITWTSGPPVLDILNVLTDEAEIASWNNEGLPADRVSSENGAIVMNCERWPLFIDPQLQGVRWIKSREERNKLVIVQMGAKNWDSKIKDCIQDGIPCLLEALPDHIDPLLDGVLSRAVNAKGQIMFNKEMIPFHPNFRFYMQTKLPNPNYRPEINAQTTLINFMVTDVGLEDQLLAVVVREEQPELESSLAELLHRMNEMTIELQQCESGLLQSLAQATGDILENQQLIENLEYTKLKASNIARSRLEAQATKENISRSRQAYRQVAVRGSLLYFQIDQLFKIDHMYQYSLEAYMSVFVKAQLKAPQAPSTLPPTERVQQRVQNVLKAITESVFAYVCRGLFERHKLIFSSLLTFAILVRSQDPKEVIKQQHLNFLLRGDRGKGHHECPESVREWLPEPQWLSVCALAETIKLDPPYSFEALRQEIEEQTRWKSWCEKEQPEKTQLHGEWKNLPPFLKLLILRCLRPDRLTAALEDFVSQAIGKFFVSDQAVPLEVSFEACGPTTPIFFILSPGVDPVAQVIQLGNKRGKTEDKELLFNVSLGQGQEVVANRALDISIANGGWAMLNNVHLVKKWLIQLEKTLDANAELYKKLDILARRKAERRAARRRARMAERAETDGKVDKPDADPEEVPHDGEGNPEGEGNPDAHEEEEEDEDDDEDEALIPRDEEGRKRVAHLDFRVFLSAEPSTNIPIGILQRSIKITNEPPTGVYANMLRALANFEDERWENSSKPAEFRSVVFAMCYFHAVVIERKKFSKQGWNRVYPFNVGDLLTCVDVLSNYVEDRPKLPWEDLRYVFGEIMYGGHITDDWDRYLCAAYLGMWVVPECIDGLDLICNPPPPAAGTQKESISFPIPGALPYADLVQYIGETLPPESPVLYGLHPNAEIMFREKQAQKLFDTITELQPKVSTAGGGKSEADSVREIIENFQGLLGEPKDLNQIAQQLDEERTPIQHVFYQECERMNILQTAMKASLVELKDGLDGNLSMTEAMSLLQRELVNDAVPASWTKVSFMSSRRLKDWFDNMQKRDAQLVSWTNDVMQPATVTNLGYFFNPMSFLTAIMQSTAVHQQSPLDSMGLVCNVTKKMADQYDQAAREGCHLTGFAMEGARWDMAAGCIEDSKMKELFPKMPVITITAATTAKINRADQHETPMYKTQERGPGFVTALWLKTKQKSVKWTVAGVGVILDVVE